MRMRSTARMWRVSCVSHANARTPNRWNSETSPALHSVWCMFIASTPIVRQVVRVALERDLDPPAAGRVHELDGGLGAEPAELVEVRGADPQPLERPVLPRDTEQAVGRRGLLHVHGEVEVGAELVVHVGHPRHPERRELRSRGARHAAPAHAGPHGGIVGAHHFAVGAQPHVRLERARTEGEGATEGRERILRLLEARAAVGEGDHSHAPSCCHAPCRTPSGPNLKARRTVAEG